MQTQGGDGHMQVKREGPQSSPTPALPVDLLFRALRPGDRIFVISVDL